jgi:hypothetical protein
MQSSSSGHAGLRVVRLIFCCVGAVFLGRALVGAVSTVSLLHERIAVDGRIIAEVQMHKAIHNGLTYAPVVRFPLEDGQPYTVQSQVHANPPEFRMGERVKVYYMRGHPQQAVINSLGQLWMGDVAMAFVGLVLVAFGTVLSSSRMTGRRVEAVSVG